MVLHGGGGVELGQAGAGLDLVGVVGAAVVQIVAQAGDHQGQALNLEGFSFALLGCGGKQEGYLESSFGCSIGAFGKREGGKESET